MNESLVGICKLDFEDLNEVSLEICPWFGNPNQANFGIAATQNDRIRKKGDNSPTAVRRQVKEVAGSTVSPTQLYRFSRDWLYTCCTN